MEHKVRHCIKNNPETGEQGRQLRIIHSIISKRTQAQSLDILTDCHSDGSTLIGQHSGKVRSNPSPAKDQNRAGVPVLFGEIHCASGSDGGIFPKIGFICQKIHASISIHRKISTPETYIPGQRRQHCIQLFPGHPSGTEGGYIQQNISNIPSRRMRYYEILFRQHLNRILDSRCISGKKNRQTDPSFTPEYDGGDTLVLDFFAQSDIMETRGEDYAETGLYS